MTRATTQEIMEKLEEIEILFKLEKFLSLGFFMISIGVAVISTGYFIANNVLTLFGGLLLIIGLEFGVIYYMLKTGKEIKRKRR